MWSIIASGIVFTMFVVSEFRSYRMEKKYILRLAKQRKHIDRLLDEKKKLKDDNDQLSLRILNQHDTIIHLSQELDRCRGANKTIE